MEQQSSSSSSRSGCEGVEGLEAIAAARAAAEQVVAACRRVAEQCADRATAQELRGVATNAAAHLSRLLCRAARCAAATAPQPTSQSPPTPATAKAKETERGGSNSSNSGDKMKVMASAMMMMKKKGKEEGGEDVEKAAEGWSCVVRGIGVVRSPFRELNGTPRQALLADEVPGEVRVFGWVQGRRALAGLEQFSHVWVVGVFHGNTNRTYHPVVAPPLLDGARTGVFGCRSPHRPNALALSLCRVDGVDAAAGVVRVRGMDLVDGTPVLDLKPFVPADMAPHARWPAWLHAPRIDRVCWTPAALAQLRQVFAAHASHSTPPTAPPPPPPRAAGHCAAGSGHLGVDLVGQQQEESGKCQDRISEDDDGDGDDEDRKEEDEEARRKKEEARRKREEKRERRARRRNERVHGVRVVGSAEEAQRVVEQMLRLDVRSVHAKAKHQHKEYGVTLDDVGFVYTVDDTTRTSTVVAVHHYDPRTKHVVPPPRSVPWPSAQQPDAAPSTTSSTTTPARTEHEQ